MVLQQVPVMFIKQLDEHIKTKKIKADLKKTACIGMCFSEPLVEFISEDGKSITYGRS